MEALRLVTQPDVEQIKHFFLNTRLTRPFSLVVKGLDLKVDVAYLSTAPAADVDGFARRVFSGPGLSNPITHAQSTGTLYMNVGRWGSTVRPDSVQLVLGSSLFAHRFNQVELAVCLTDGAAIYLTKNISSHGGEGAIVRINVNSDEDDRNRRRQRLIDALDADVFEFEQQDHIVIATLPVAAMRTGPEKLLPKALSAWLKYAFEIEAIRNASVADVDVPVSGEKAGGSHRWMLSAADRRRIEDAAMDQASTWLQSEGWRVQDVSDKYVGYDLLAQKARCELYVEVKGTTRIDWAIEMTVNEVNTAEAKGAAYLLFIAVFDDVTSLQLVDSVRIPDPTRSAACAVTPLRYLVRPG